MILTFQVEATKQSSTFEVTCLYRIGRRWRNFYSRGVYRPLMQGDAGVVLRVDSYEARVCWLDCWDEGLLLDEFYRKVEVPPVPMTTSTVRSFRPDYLHGCLQASMEDERCKALALTLLGGDLR